MTKAAEKSTKDVAASATVIKKGQDTGPSMVFEIPSLNIAIMHIRLIGETPLVVHQWSEKAKKEILDKQMKKAKQAKEARNPEKELLDSAYWISKKPKKLAGFDLSKASFGFPAVAFKKAAVGACRAVSGITMTLAAGAFHVLADSGRLVTIEGTPEPQEDCVRIGQGTSDLRYRFGFPEWSVTLRVKYNTNCLTPEQIMNLFNTAGFHVGVGEGRVEKKGECGMFHVATDGE